MTVGGKSDKVKPNGKNWLNSSSNRHCPSLPISTLRQNATTPAVTGFPVHRGVKAGLARALGTLWRSMSNVIQITSLGSLNEAGRRPCGADAWPGCRNRGRESYAGGCNACRGATSLVTFRVACVAISRETAVSRPLEAAAGSPGSPAAWHRARHRRGRAARRAADQGVTCVFSPDTVGREDIL